MNKEEISININYDDNVFHQLLSNFKENNYHWFKCKFEDGSELDLVEKKDYEILQQENKQLKEKCEYLKEQKENKNKWFQLIADIGYDYDGMNTIEGLKGLIDELVQYALNGRDDDDYEQLMYEGDDDK